MIQKYLLSIDLDGTLLNDKSVISRYSKSALHAFLIAYPTSIILLNSGRPMNHMKIFLKNIMKDLKEELHQNLYASSDNGCWLINYEEKSIYKDSFPPKLICKIWKEACAIDLNPFAHIGEQTYMAYMTKQARQILRRHNTIMHFKTKSSIVQSIDHVKNIDLPKFTLLQDEPEKKQIALRFIKEKSSAYNYSWAAAEEMFFMIMASSKTKATPIQKLSKKHKIKRQNIFIFADSDNDLPSFKTTENIIIPKSSNENLMLRAKHAIGANDQDGVAKFIMKHFLKK